MKVVAFVRNHRTEGECHSRRNYSFLESCRIWRFGRPKGARSCDRIHSQVRMPIRLGLYSTTCFAGRRQMHRGYLQLPIAGEIPCQQR